MTRKEICSLPFFGPFPTLYQDTVPPWIWDQAINNGVEGKENLSVEEISQKEDGETVGLESAPSKRTGTTYNSKSNDVGTTIPNEIETGAETSSEFSYELDNALNPKVEQNMIAIQDYPSEIIKSIRVQTNQTLEEKTTC